jgi:hypothetical protein
MTFIYYGMSCVISVLLCSAEPRPSRLKKRIYNPCVMQIKNLLVICQLKNSTLTGDEMDLEIEGETVSEESSNEMSESESETSVVC